MNAHYDKKSLTHDLERRLAPSIITSFSSKETCRNTLANLLYFIRRKRYVAVSNYFVDFNTRQKDSEIIVAE